MREVWDAIQEDAGKLRRVLRERRAELQGKLDTTDPTTPDLDTDEEEATVKKEFVPKVVKEIEKERLEESGLIIQELIQEVNHEFLQIQAIFRRHKNALT